MATGKHRDPVTGEFVPLTYRGTGPAQSVPAAPPPRFVGDLWVDTDDDSTLSWDTNWQYPPLLNGWINYPAAQFGQARYMKKPGGLVVIEGLVRAGTRGAAIFILPVGYRPVGEIIWTPQVSFPYMGHGYIYRDGSVVCHDPAPGGNTNDWITLTVAFYGE